MVSKGSFSTCVFFDQTESWHPCGFVGTLSWDFGIGCWSSTWAWLPRTAFSLSIHKLSAGGPQGRFARCFLFKCCCWVLLMYISSLCSMGWVKGKAQGHSHSPRASSVDLFAICSQSICDHSSKQNSWILMEKNSQQNGSTRDQRKNPFIYLSAHLCLFSSSFPSSLSMSMSLSIVHRNHNMFHQIIHHHPTSQLSHPSLSIIIQPSHSSYPLSII